jgi:Spy/CpxP family protein refolding chaperone
MANERRFKGYALLVATFLLGVATGGGASYASMQRHYARMFRDRPDMLESRRLGALARRLDLDDSQRDRVSAIMEKYSDDRRALTRDMFARCGEKMKAAQDALDNDVRRTLRPDQMSRYDALVKERREHFGFGRP